MRTPLGLETWEARYPVLVFLAPVSPILATTILVAVLPSSVVTATAVTTTTISTAMIIRAL